MFLVKQNLNNLLKQKENTSDQKLIKCSSRNEQNAAVLGAASSF